MGVLFFLPKDDKTETAGDAALANRALTMQGAAGGGEKLLKVFDETTCGKEEY